MFFLVVLIALIGSTAPCEVGVPHESSTLNIPRLASTSGPQVYLGLENPASCGGYLTNYTICYYNARSGRPVTEGELSIWEAGPELFDRFRVYDKIIESVLDLPFTTDNDTSCGIGPVVTPISNAPGPYPAREIVCMYYCLPETSTVLVKPGSVVGIVYTDGVKYNNRGQMLTRHTFQTAGTCVGNSLRFSLGDIVGVTCPLVPANTTTGLLAGAGIEPIYCPELSLQYGSINISGPYSYGTGIEYTCQTGFQLAGVSSQTCLSSGDWSDELPYCNVLNCTDPGVPSNGRRRGNHFTNGSLIEFICDNGFTLNGTSLIMCYRGNWSAPVPVCISNTPSPSSSSSSYLLPTTSNTIANTTASSSPSTTSDSNQFAYQFLTAIFITIILLIILVLASALVFLYAYRKCFRSKRRYTMTDPISYAQLDRPLLENDHLEEVSDEIYDKVKSDEGPVLPPRAAVMRFSNPGDTGGNYSEREGKATPVYGGAVPYRGATKPIFIERGGGPRGIYARRENKGQEYNHPPSVQSLPFPSPIGQGGGPGSRLSTQSFPANLGYGGHYEVYIPQDEDDDESPYWVPADFEDELYLQLDQIKVKKIPSAELNVMEILGSGQFAYVSRALWTKPEGESIEVAVKVLSDEADENDKIRFLQEAALMGQFTHTNVLTLHGVVSSEDTTIMIVIELMKGGDLRHWLMKRKREKSYQANILLNFCRQICLGMCYLSSRKFVHRDLAARNILVTHDNICKISDFGMSRDLTETDYYTASEGGLIPVKWTAPEALKFRKYSSASDVWSYGCLMYEIWSLGHKPFDTIKNNEYMKKISSGYRLQPVPGCPKMMYEIMMKCWHPESKKRPSFNEIMLLLLKDDSTLLLIPDEDRLTHSEAGQLGGPLEAGDKLYTDLQSMYIDDEQ
ncbi:PREDICTED: uncharacterized protein LOC109584225 [Amphimedon queenslandica]|uniref:Protein kinase domain-containing protein n=2 Tax=Amphimedon queenslandica TaxID=400682 RepID=A0AAN0JEM5_AMPQE|nr:PREDICTED: uncharacterized protein LOC109584225 [Amphimedon queenslandica]|eukprot:XP_019855444.1 PREDICTED: uncharacterized protein LOC109584225 [Amphimedon queenslandica]